MGSKCRNAVRLVLGDGSFGGAYARSDEDMLAVWAVGVDETRERIEALTLDRSPVGQQADRLGRRKRAPGED